MMTGSENRGEKQPGWVPLQTGPGRDAIARSAIVWGISSPDRTSEMYCYHTARLSRRQPVLQSIRKIGLRHAKHLNVYPNPSQSGTKHLVNRGFDSLTKHVLK